MTTMGNMTTISVSKKTRDALAALGSKKETYEDVILRLVEEAGFKAYEKRWNKILAEDDFVPLEDL
jgi:hypothetical protein